MNNITDYIIQCLGKRTHKKPPHTSHKSHKFKSLPYFHTSRYLADGCIKWVWLPPLPTHSHNPPPYTWRGTGRSKSWEISGKKTQRYFFCLVAVAMALNLCVCVPAVFCFVFYFYACRVMFTCWGESKDKFPRLVGQWKFYSNLLITLFYTNIFSQHWNCARRLCRCPGRACYMYIMKHRALWKTAYGKQMSFASQSAVCECAITAH